MKSLVLAACAAAMLLPGSELFAQNLLKPTNVVESWQFEQHEGAEGKISVDGESIKFEVTKSTGTDWHIQAFIVDLDLKEGQQYVVEFEAMAAAFTSPVVNAGINQDDWHAIGLSEQIYLGKKFDKYKYTFTATDVVAKKNRLGLTMGSEKCTIWLKNFTLTEKK